MKNTADTPSFHDARTGYLAADAIQNPTATAGVGPELVPDVERVRRQRARRRPPRSDPDTANAGSITTSTDTPDECDPAAAIAPVGDRPEGSDIAFDGTGSTVGRRQPATRWRYAWDLDGDGTYDDSTSATPDVGLRRQRLPHRRPPGDQQLGLHRHHVGHVQHHQRGADGDHRPVRPGRHGGERDPHGRGATFSDPGWLDTYAGNVDLGTTYRPDVTPASSVTTQGGQGARLTPVGPRPTRARRRPRCTYGDNGTYTVTVDGHRRRQRHRQRQRRRRLVANVDPTVGHRHLRRAGVRRRLGVRPRGGRGPDRAGQLGGPGLGRPDLHRGTGTARAERRDADDRADLAQRRGRRPRPGAQPERAARATSRSRRPTPTATRAPTTWTSP